MCQVLVTTAIDALLITRTKHIFIGGGFLSHPLTAKIVMEEFEVRKWQAATNLDFVVSLEFEYLLNLLR